MTTNTTRHFSGDVVEVEVIPDEGNGGNNSPFGAFRADGDLKSVLHLDLTNFSGRLTIRRLFDHEDLGDREKQGGGQLHDDEDEDATEELKKLEDKENDEATSIAHDKNSNGPSTIQDNAKIPDEENKRIEDDDKVQAASEETKDTGLRRRQQDQTTNASVSAENDNKRVDDDLEKVVQAFETTLSPNKESLEESTRNLGDEEECQHDFTASSFRKYKREFTTKFPSGDSTASDNTSRRAAKRASFVTLLSSSFRSSQKKGSSAEMQLPSAALFGTTSPASEGAAVGDDDEDEYDEEPSKKKEPPTRLHEICQRPSVTLEELQEALSRQPEAISVVDADGRLPLHILGDNEDLLAKAEGRRVATNFGRQLIRAYPKSITTMDYRGHMPFVTILHDWLTWVYHVHGQSDGAQKERKALSMNSSVQDISLALFPRAVLWDEADWSFAMLSFAIDELGRPTGRAMNTYQRYKRKHARRLLATHVVEKVPNLLKTILVVEDFGDDVRRRLLNTSILRRILLCPESVGPWLTGMLYKRGTPSIKAVDYLQFISETTVEDYIGRCWTIRGDDIQEYLQHRLSVFQGIEQLDGVITSLVVLDSGTTERAASTRVLTYVMNTKLGRPFLVALVMIDFIMNVILLETFRTIIHAEGQQFGMPPFVMVYVVCAHFVLRITSEAMAMGELSRRVLFSYVVNVWTILDATAIGLALFSSTWMLYNPGQFLNGMNAMVIGLLWLKILRFLKVVNKQLSTFILALFQILIDLRYFIVVFVVVVAMFADMLHVAVKTKDDGHWCVANEKSLGAPAQDFCSTAGASLLRVYSLIIGDVSLDDWLQTPGMTVLFIMVTVVGVIILLNVLIAVISDSYEKARVSSLLLLGRSRVTFLARNHGLESFFLPGGAGGGGGACGALFRQLVMVSLVASAAFADAYLLHKLVTACCHRVHIMWGVVGIIICSLLTMALIGLGTNMVLCWCGSHTPPILTWFDNFVVEPFLGLVASVLFGLAKEEERLTIDSIENGADDDGWTGRLAFMQKLIGTAKDDILYEISDIGKVLRERDQGINPVVDEFEDTRTHDGAHNSPADENRSLVVVSDDSSLSVII